jgi:mannitol 2-dehydrogenase
MVLERFANPKVKDELQRLARRGSGKLPSYLLPSIVEARAAHRRYDLLLLAVAGWVRYLRGVDLDGEEIDVEDPRKDELQPLALQGGGNPRPLLAERSIFGALAGDGEFASRLQEALALIERDGPRAAINAYLSTTDTVAEHAA